MKNKDEFAKQIGNRIKELRKEAGLTLKQLAKAIELSAPLISKIENGLAMPSLPTLRLIADALKVNAGYFFQGEDDERGYVISVKEKRTQTVSARGYLAELLAEGMENPFMEPVILELEERDKEKEVILSTHDGQEFIYVLEGKIELILGAKRFLLKAGDAAYWNGNIPHKGWRVSKKRARTLNVHLIPGRRTGTFS